VLRANIEHWDEYYGKMTEDEKRQVYHAAIRRIAVDFTKDTAVVTWTFAKNSAKIDLAHEKARSRRRARGVSKGNIDAASSGLGSMVVEIGANRQSCDPSTKPVFKLILDAVMSVVGAEHRA
jgi:hypothetical protein